MSASVNFWGTIRNLLPTPKKVEHTSAVESQDEENESIKYMLDIKNLWTEFECPKCGYNIDIRLIDVETESTVPCYCCKTWIKLIDQEGSTTVGIKSMESAITQLENTLKKFSK